MSTTLTCPLCGKQVRPGTHNNNRNKSIACNPPPILYAARREADRIAKQHERDGDPKTAAYWRSLYR